MTAPATETSSAEWESRTLCPDDSCIGVLDLEGRCNVCGQRGERPPAATGTAGSAELDDEDPETPAQALVVKRADAAGDLAADDASVGDSFAERELCPDDNCIGVLDAAGTCKLCGAPKSSQGA